MANLTLKAFVLRTVPYGENQRLLNLLSEEGEMLTASCTKSKKMSSINVLSQAFVLAEFELFSYRERLRVDGGQLIYAFSGLQEDWDRMAAISHLAEVYVDALHSVQKLAQAYPLWAYSAYQLAGSTRALLDVRIAQLRFVSDLGFRPWLCDCTLCHSGDQAGAFFNFALGGIVCARHRQSARVKAEDNMPLSAGLLASLRYVIDCEYQALFRFNLTDKVEQEFVTFSDLYLDKVMEKQYKRLGFAREMALFHRDLSKAQEDFSQNKEQQV